MISEGGPGGCRKLQSKSRKAELISPVIPYAQSSVADTQMCVHIYILSKVPISEEVPRYLDMKNSYMYVYIYDSVWPFPTERGEASISVHAHFR